MLYLNVRHSFPKIATSNDFTKITRAGHEQAQLSRSLRLARSNVYPEGLKLEINTYPSRHSYGFSTMKDFCREHRDKSLQDIVATTSKHTQAAWDVIENGAKPNKRTFFSRKAAENLYQEVMKQRYIEVQSIPDPEIHITPYHIAGQNDVGDDHYDIKSTADAPIEVHKGKCDMYTKDAGYIRMWTSEGGYDTRA